MFRNWRHQNADASLQCSRVVSRKGTRGKGNKGIVLEAKRLISVNGISMLLAIRCFFKKGSVEIFNRDKTDDRLHLCISVQVVNLICRPLLTKENKVYRRC